MSLIPGLTSSSQGGTSEQVPRYHDSSAASHLPAGHDGVMAVWNGFHAAVGSAGGPSASYDQDGAIRAFSTDGAPLSVHHHQSQMTVVFARESEIAEKSKRIADQVIASYDALTAQLSSLRSELVQMTLDVSKKAPADQSAAREAVKLNAELYKMTGEFVADTHKRICGEAKDGLLFLSQEAATSVQSYYNVMKTEIALVKDVIKELQDQESGKLKFYIEAQTARMKDEQQRFDNAYKLLEAYRGVRNEMFDQQQSMEAAKSKRTLEEEKLQLEREDQESARKLKEVHETHRHEEALASVEKEKELATHAQKLKEGEQRLKELDLSNKKDERRLDSERKREESREKMALQAQEQQMKAQMEHNKMMMQAFSANKNACSIS